MGENNVSPPVLLAAELRSTLDSATIVLGRGQFL